MTEPSGPETAAGARRVALDPLRRLTTDIFAAHGLSEADARQCAQVLTSADARGVWSHGVARVSMYCRRLSHGAAKARPEITVERVAAAAALVDGDDGLGLVVARRAVETAVQISGETGVALVGARRSGHFGMAAAHARIAVDAGRVVWIFTNASRALPPWGGAEPLFGTSPLCVAAPTAPGDPPFMLDMAMSMVARGKLKFAAQRGEPIPPGLALDKHGRPTIDGAEAYAGVMLPFGGVKGAGLSWMMDVLGGVLTGAAHGGTAGNPFGDVDRPQGTGHLVLAARADLFMPLETFHARMAEVARAAKSSPRAEGVAEIFSPGEIEAAREVESERSGVTLTPDVLDDLRALAEAKGVAWPF